MLGYKKEMFYYLEDKYGVKFIINDSFNIKNNIESLYLARKELKNTYICVSDSYYIENPFNQFEYHTFYSGYYGKETTDEVYARADGFGKITRIARDNKIDGYVLMGHSFWRKEFSEAFINQVEAVRESGIYNNCYWEILVKINLMICLIFSLKSIFQVIYLNLIILMNLESLIHSILDIHIVR